jgi:hypothetical protein
MSQQSLESRKPHDYVHRLFGGPPLAVIGRLILLSILVGVILTAIGLDPWNIIDSVRRLILHIWNMGFDAVRWLWQYFLLGAVIVLPICPCCGDGCGWPPVMKDGSRSTSSSLVGWKFWCRGW